MTIRGVSEAQSITLDKLLQGSEEGKDFVSTIALGWSTGNENYYICDDLAQTTKVSMKNLASVITSMLADGLQFPEDSKRDLKKYMSDIVSTAVDLQINREVISTQNGISTYEGADSNEKSSALEWAAMDYHETLPSQYSGNTQKLYDDVQDSLLAFSRNDRDDSGGDWDTAHGMTLNVSEFARQVVNMALDYINNGDSSSNKKSFDIAKYDNTENKDKYQNSSSTLNVTINDRGYTVGAYEAVLKSACGNDTSKYKEMLGYLKADAEGSGQTKSVTSEVKYWLSIYDALCEDGAMHDTEIDKKKSSFSDKVDSGTYLIEDCNLLSLEGEVEDEEERAKADKFYEESMNKIHRKEKQLDKELTKLQTEYSALTNDYNSVKAIIDSNVQRSFAYCQA